MIEARKSTYAAALGVFFALLLLLPEHGMAIPPGPNGTAPGCPCIPNAANYGYFKTSWRQWPGESRADTNFPRRIGKEVIPTPAGVPEEKPQPAPKEAAPAAKGKGGAITIPFQLGPGGGLMLPGPKPKSEGEVPGLETKPQGPTEPGQAPTPPLPGGGLPGLPSEPTGAAPSEGAAPPKEAAPTEAAPSPEGPTAPGTVAPPKDAKPMGESGSPPSARSRKPDSHSALLGLLATPDDTQLLTLRTGSETVSSAPEPEMAAEPASGQRVIVPSSVAAEVRLSEPGAGKLQSLTVPPDQTSPVKSALYVSAGLPPGDSCLLAAAVEQTSCETATDLPAAAPGAEEPAPPVEKQVEKRADKPVAQQPRSHAAEGAWRPNNPPVALGGYCPVTLGKSDRWVKGSPRWSAVHQGRTYLFASAVQRECFLVDPERYIPSCSGHDPVLLIDEHLRVAGQLDYCIAYGGRLYMFSSEATLARFRQAPQRYVTAVH